MKTINVTQSSMPSYEEYCEEIKSVWESVHLTNRGPIHNRLAQGLKNYLKVDGIELCVNGHLALYCAIKALNLKGEIITTPFTFASTTNAIVQAGCTPVFCDVKDDFTINESKIESLITPQTVAILGVHVYGNVCDVDAIKKIADKHSLKVIYDAAHAFGVEYDGRGIGTYGDVSMFSFHATKVFHTIEGGCLTFSDLTLADKIKKQANFGIDGDDLYCFGTNAKMNEFQSAMGICNLRHIDEELALRKVVFQRYLDNLKYVKGVKTLGFNDKTKQNYAYLPILIDKKEYGMDRDELKDLLAKNGINARKYFYPLVSENKEFGCDLTDQTPYAKYCSHNVLCLPLYARLALDDVDAICKIIIER